MPIYFYKLLQLPIFLLKCVYVVNKQKKISLQIYPWLEPFEMKILVRLTQNIYIPNFNILITKMRTKRLIEIFKNNCMEYQTYNKSLMDGNIYFEKKLRRFEEEIADLQVFQ